MKTGTYPGGTLPAHPGPAGGDTGSRSCATCGAPQTASARYCWHCLSQSGGGLHAHSTTQAPTTPAHRIRYEIMPAAPSRGVDRVRGLVPRQVVVGLGVVALLSVLLRGPAYTVPESVGDAVRLSTPAYSAAEDAWRDSLVDAGIEGEVAIFGTNGTASFVLVAYGARPGSDRGALTQLGDAWTGVSDSTVRTSSIQDSRRGGFGFACAPVSGGGFRSICAWADPQGFVGGILSMDSGQTETLGIAAQARLAML